MPSTFPVPYSSRYGYSSRCARTAERTPVPPARVWRISTPSRTYIPPMPVGPNNDLCPVNASTSICICSTSIGIFPAVCDASTTSSTPCCGTARPISAIGCTVPMTFDAWLTATTRVFGLMRARISSGSTKPAASKGT